MCLRSSPSGISPLVGLQVYVCLYQANDFTSQWKTDLEQLVAVRPHSISTTFLCLPSTSATHVSANRAHLFHPRVHLPLSSVFCITSLRFIGRYSKNAYLWDDFLVEPRAVCVQPSKCQRRTTYQVFSESYNITVRLCYQYRIYGY